MAAMSCFHCQHSGSGPDDFRNGWRLRSGHYAQLCLRCASEYEEGRFCETFHSNDDGWRDCESCGKLIHCGCIVSFDTHLLLDFGGIICMECSRFNFLLVGEDYTFIWPPSSGVYSKARKRCLSLETEIRVQEPHQKSSGQGQAHALCWPQVTALELQQVSRIPKATVSHLFEKVLSASDSDLKLARLIIPKKYAETCLPHISGSNGLPLKIQDTDGSEWQFHYRYWLSGGNRIYVLEGLRDYMLAKKWQPGDTVTFYRVEPGGKVVMGLRKTSIGLQVPWSDN